MTSTFTEYMNKSLELRKNTEAYLICPTNLAQKVLCINIIDKMDYTANKNEDFRNEVMNWFKGKTKTIALRQFLKSIGYDYWENLTNSNAIDVFDTISANNNN